MSSLTYDLTLAGLSVGAAAALTGIGLIVTYRATGVLNFAHGAIAMVCAYVLRQCVVVWDWPQWWSAALTLVVVAPGLGVVLERFVFRPLAVLGGDPAQTLVASIGVFVLLVGGAALLWGQGARDDAPVLVAAEPWGQLAVVAVLAAGVAGVVRFSRFGRELRAVVDDRQLAVLSGVDADRVAAVGWAFGSFTAGLTGVLLAPYVRLDPYGLPLLVMEVLAVAVAARMRSLPVAVVVALGIGVAQSQLTRLHPSGWGQPLVQALGANLFVVALLVAALVLPGVGTRDALPRTATARVPTPSGAWIVAGVLFLLPLGFAGPDLHTAVQVPALGVVLLSLVVVTGRGGQISLGQAAYAGLGALFTALLAAGRFPGLPRMPELAALATAVVLVAPLGVLTGWPAIGRRGLALAIATFAVGVGVSRFVFAQPYATAGLTLDRPAGFDGDRAYYVLELVLLLCALAATGALRRGRIGRALAAMRDHEPGARAAGVRVPSLKLLAFVCGAALAALGGGMLGMGLRAFDPAAYDPVRGLLWFAAVVVLGADSTLGALLAAALLVGLDAGTRGGMAAAVIGVLAILVGRFPGGPYEGVREAARRLRLRLRGAPALTPYGTRVRRRLHGPPPQPTTRPLSAGATATGAGTLARARGITAGARPWRGAPDLGAPRGDAGTSGTPAASGTAGRPTGTRAAGTAHGETAPEGGPGTRKSPAEHRKGFRGERGREQGTGGDTGRGEDTRGETGQGESPQGETGRGEGTQGETETGQGTQGETKPVQGGSAGQNARDAQGRADTDAPEGTPGTPESAADHREGLRGDAGRAEAGAAGRDGRETPGQADTGAPKGRRGPQESAVGRQEAPREDLGQHPAETAARDSGEAQGRTDTGTPQTEPGPPESAAEHHEGSRGDAGRGEAGAGGRDSREARGRADTGASEGKPGARESAPDHSEAPREDLGQHPGETAEPESGEAQGRTDTGTPQTEPGPPESAAEHHEGSRGEGAERHGSGTPDRVDSGTPQAKPSTPPESAAEHHEGVRGGAGAGWGGREAQGPGVGRGGRRVEGRTDSGIPEGARGGSVRRRGGGGRWGSWERGPAVPAVDAGGVRAGSLPVLEARGLRAGYGGFTALDGVDLRVPAGRVTAVVGANGAGKSTLFHCLAGTLRPVRGVVRFGGREITRRSADARTRLGIARTFQQLAVFPTLTVAENVRIGAEQGRVSDPGAVERTLRLLGLDGRVRALPAAELPTGTLRRVELARALAGGPRVLLLDEPAAGLDTGEVTALARILRALAADGMALLVVEHDLDLVAGLADVVHVMAAGRIVASGPPGHVLDTLGEATGR